MSVKDSLFQSSLGFAQGIFSPGGRFRGGPKSSPLLAPGPAPVYIDSILDSSRRLVSDKRSA